MKTLSVSISDIEYQRLNIKDDKISFSELVDIINREIIKQNLDECIYLAEQCKLSAMTMKDIDLEIKSVRENAENNS